MQAEVRLGVRVACVDTWLPAWGLVPHGSWSLALLPRKRVAEEEPSTSAAVPVAKKKPSRGFGDFSSW